MELREEVLKIAKQAKEAAQKLANLSSTAKNEALLRMAENLEARKDEIQKKNRKDIILAEKKGLSRALIDRLTLNEKRITQMSDSLKEIAKLEDPVGRIESMWRRPNGLLIGRIRVPLGVIGIIYESRPNVTVDAAGLCLKAGNAVILRGGSEAINSNIALSDVLSEAIEEAGLPPGCAQLIKTTDRKAVEEMLKLDEYIDVIIPRGGESLIQMVTKNSTIPVIKHYKGVCHVYVDEEADLKMAER